MKVASTKSVILNAAMLFVLISVVGLGYYAYNTVGQSLLDGPHRPYLDEPIAKELMEGTSIALNAYHSTYKRYPQVDGKLLIDSLKPFFPAFLERHKINLYYDSLMESGTTSSYSLIDFPETRPQTSHRNLFWGVGNGSSPILLRVRENNDYFMYYVGENDLDENGQGDDILYKK